MKLVPKEIQADIVDNTSDSEVMYFTTEDSASWFVRRRLSYNPVRTDQTKLNFMNDIFLASDMEDVTKITKKYMFNIVAC